MIVLQTKRSRHFWKIFRNERIKVKILESNVGISEATNQAEKISTGEFLLLMDNDDIIHPEALERCYHAVLSTNCDIVYSDQDIIDEKNVHKNPLYKPDWSPDLILSQMYVGHLLGFRRELFEAVVQEWEVVSAGEQHPPVELGRGVVMNSVGKLSIDGYAQLLNESYAGISLMASPHPSYPPLEMSVYGIKVITNTFANKDLTEFNENIVSVSRTAPAEIASQLKHICDGYMAKTERKSDKRKIYK